MIKITRTTSTNPDFIGLVKELDAHLAVIDGDEHEFYTQFNKTNTLNYVVIVYESNKPIGCGTLKEYTQNALEIKRMYTVPDSRGKGIATQVLIELEQWATELAYKKCVLETGIRQKEAIGLYTKNGYKRIPNYGQYAGIANSVCFEKEIK